MNGRLYAYALCSLLLAATLAPAFGDPHDDAFPFSTYPMFATARARVESVTSALVVNADGTETIVPGSFISSSEPMQAVVTLHRTVRAGPKALQRLCRDVAARISSAAEPSLASGTHVVIVTRRVDSIAYLGGRTEAVGGKEHTRCKLSTARLP